jgi:hypothetical protein
MSQKSPRGCQENKSVVNQENNRSDGDCGAKLDFDTVVCGPELHANDTDWPQYARAEDREPGTREESEDVFVVVIDGCDSGDKGQYADGYSEGVDVINVTNDFAVANRSG